MPIIQLLGFNNLTFTETNMNQVKLHKEWNKDVDNTISIIKDLSAELEKIQTHAAMVGLDDLDLPKLLDGLAARSLEKLHESLEPVFQKVGTVYERGE